MLEYFSYVIGFLATLLGVLGKTSKEKSKFPKNITLIGWLSLVLALAALTTSVLVKYNTKIDKDRYQFWALRELEFSTYKLLKPYLLNTDPPEDSDRYKITTSLIQIGMFTAYCTYNLTDTCYCYPRQTYAQFSTSTTKEAINDMGSVLTRFSNYLPSNIVELTTEIRTDPWVELMLDASDRVQQFKLKMKYPFYGNRPSIQKLYLEKAVSFSHLVEKLEKEVGIEMTQIAAELKIKNPAPPYLAPLNQ